MKIVEKKDKHTVVSIILMIILILYTICMLYPYLWAFISSLKTYTDFRTNMFGFPDKIMWNNYILAFDNFFVKIRFEGTIKTVYLEEMFLNSFFYVFGCALASTMVPCLTAYVVATFDFKFGKVINFIVYMCMILPIIGNLPSEIQMTQFLHIYDTMVGMWFLKCSFLGMYYLIFHATFKGIAKEYSESAYMDGANNFQVMTQIALPLVKTTIMIVFILGVIGYWNDYTTPLMFLPSRPTIALGLFLFNESKVNALATIPMKFTACFIMTIPVLVVFIIFRNKIIGNLSLGGIKE